MGQARELLKDKKKTVSYAKWLAEYVKPYTGRIIIMMMLSLLSTVMSLVMVNISRNIIDSATGGNPIVRLIVVYVALMLVMQIISAGSSIFNTYLSEHFSFNVRKEVYQKIVNSHWMDVKKYHSGDLMTRLTSDAQNISDGLMGTIPNIIELFIELLMVFVMLFVYSPLLAVLSLTVAPVAAIASWWLGRKLKKLQVKVQENEAIYRSFMQESIANLLIVKSFANEEYAVDRLTTLRGNCFKWIIKRVKMGVASSTVMSLTFQIGYLAAFAYGAYEISIGQITYGTMSVFLALVNRVQAPIMMLAQQIPRVVSTLASAGRVMEIEEIPNEEKLESDFKQEKVGVEVKDLTFGYVPSEIVLDKVNLDVKPGEFVAIIGESGIGKTTLIRLIMSFMSKYEGSITFKNDNGDELTANAAARDFMSYVPQGNTLFSGTIRENIRMGKLDATEDEMIEAMKMAAAYDFVMELPQGIDTVIGERGHGISEGQAQRIAIARAFVRKAPFLILDEATSALDEQTELNVIKGLQQLSPKPTCIVVTHRKSILQYCDREIKIENRAVSEI